MNRVGLQVAAARLPASAALEQSTPMEIFRSVFMTSPCRLTAVAVWPFVVPRRSLVTRIFLPDAARNAWTGSSPAHESAAEGRSRMFLGHFGLGFAGKRIAPHMSLGSLFLAV